MCIRDRKKRLHFGLVFQNFNLFPQYTALENVMLAGELLAKEQPGYKANKKAIPAQLEACLLYTSAASSSTLRAGRCCSITVRSLRCGTMCSAPCRSAGKCSWPTAAPRWPGRCWTVCSAC